MIEYLRSMVLMAPGGGERFHAVFVDSRKAYLGDESMGRGERDALSLRLRDLFGKALRYGASGIIIAHNHPSGDCRPSQYDIDATQRVAAIAQALDIELLDHLIFSDSAVYSMRAGGDL
ncbi:JAB domain-containing protein [Erythrobacter sp. JK5]|uniref:JAB domain-containing protein n=1 Tax=Erythrobacter sp. JK5 TaxID=2829500 RepID=UPI002013B8EE|nr:JAB domain-containing protein [Erythrobacter sp. JK5]